MKVFELMQKLDDLDPHSEVVVAFEIYKKGMDTRHMISKIAIVRGAIEGEDNTKVYIQT